MRVNEVVSRLDDLEIVNLRYESLCWQGTKIELLHDERFYNDRLGDMIVTHLGICDSCLGIGLLIKGERL